MTLLGLQSRCRQGRFLGRLQGESLPGTPVSTDTAFLCSRLHHPSTASVITPPTSFFFLFGPPRSTCSSQARDQIQAAASTYTEAVAKLDPLTHYAGLCPWCCGDMADPAAPQWELLLPPSCKDLSDDTGPTQLPPGGRGGSFFSGET